MRFLILKVVAALYLLLALVVAVVAWWLCYCGQPARETRWERFRESAVIGLLWGPILLAILVAGKEPSAYEEEEWP